MTPCKSLQKRRSLSLSLSFSPNVGVYFATMSHLSFVHRLRDELLIFRFARGGGSDRRANYSRAAGQFNPPHTVTTVTVTMYSEFGCKYAQFVPREVTLPPLKAEAPDYRQKSSLPRRSICDVSYMPSYPIFPR